MARSPIEDLLDDASVARLRKAYQRSDFDAAARGRLVAIYPPGGALPTGVVDHFFPVEGGALPADDRERIVLSVLLAQGAEAGQVAIHVYWGLMEGLTVREVVECFLLTGYYAGIHRYQRGLAIASATLKLLAELAKVDAGVPVVLETLMPAVKGL